MNLPNKLTTSRIALTMVFLVAVFIEFPGNRTLALILFVVASITDWLDGAIARRRKLITNFGILMDPLADKILTCSAFIAFVGQGYVAAWMVVVVVARELTITGLRLLAASKNVVLAAERYGKHKTISQMVTVSVILVKVSYPDWGSVAQAIFGFQIGGQSWLHHVAFLSLWLTVALTFISGCLYLWRNRQLYLNDM
ncbi:MAG TPA: CDP-diacylglycerol--glycerol-3-phosphate 3-phosphatidyltransferase [Verrucomicrobiae bacterium]|nr:CDP-diacylglycerol--glycerol-3-phosphate 3-phosphatidyltransferase [Verrucomicrobiae bacterium]